jgi:hypothetical protein
MDCSDITTVEQAEATIPSSVLPISGLRRNDDDTLTDDARNTIIDGLKSRDIDLNNMESRKKIVADLISLFCSLSKQYGFLMKEPMNEQRIKILTEKNIMIVDILTISRHIMKLPMAEGSMGAVSDIDISPMLEKLQKERQGFKEGVKEGFSDEVQKYMVDVSREKNRIASNYLGIYGFLNLFAVGLLIYVAASK